MGAKKAVENFLIDRGFKCHGRHSDHYGEYFLYRKRQDFDWFWIKEYDSSYDLELEFEYKPGLFTSVKLYNRTAEDILNGLNTDHDRLKVYSNLLRESPNV